MKPLKLLVLMLCLLVQSPLTLLTLRAASLSLSSPCDYQVVQRSSRTRGTISIVARLEEAGFSQAPVEARLVLPSGPGKWRRVGRLADDGTVSGSLSAPAGGWYRLEVRVGTGASPVALGRVEHVGVGEVFVVAGQSNSANHGEEKLQTTTGRVTTFDGARWQLCRDPQPGASGGGGSFLPPFGDAVVQHCEVPVGFVACGIGATSVREWLPPGAQFPNPPTLVGRVRQLPSGAWESKGEAYAMLVKRMKSMGHRGFRAVLWHQGESDANQADPTRTLPGSLYREYLERIIRDSRRDVGWPVPWSVALVSYHVPGDEASPDIRAAQAAIAKDGVAWSGPDSDALKGALRDSGGNGIHFSGAGLRELARQWLEVLRPRLDR